MPLAALHTPSSFRLGSPTPYVNSNGTASLTVFDYGVTPGGTPSDMTVNAIQQVRRAWQGVHQSERTHEFGIVEYPAQTALDPGNVLWESWPCYSGIALLWTDYPVLGAGFRADWNVTQLQQQARRWAETNPTDLSLIPSWADVVSRQDHARDQMGPND